MNKTTEAFDAWWADEGEQSLYALNTTTDDDIKILAGIAWEAAIREALAEPDTKSGELHDMKTELWKAEHSGDANEMVADTNPLSVFAKECVLGAYTYDELPEAARLALKRAKKAEPVKQEPKKWVDLTNEEYEMLCQGNAPMNIRVRTVAMALKHKNQGD